MFTPLDPVQAYSAAQANFGRWLAGQAQIRLGAALAAAASHVPGELTADVESAPGAGGTSVLGYVDKPAPDPDLSQVAKIHPSGAKHLAPADYPPAYRMGGRPPAGRGHI